MCFSSISTAVIDELPYCVLEVVVRGHTLRVLTVPVGFSVGLLPILLVWTLLVAEALYGTRLQVARVSFKPAFVDEETCSIYCTLPYLPSRYPSARGPEETTDVGQRSGASLPLLHSSVGDFVSAFSLAVIIAAS